LGIGPGIKMRFGCSDHKWMMWGLKRFELVHFRPLPEGVKNTFDWIAFVE